MPAYIGLWVLWIIYLLVTRPAIEALFASVVAISIIVVSKLLWVAGRWVWRTIRY